MDSIMTPSNYLAGIAVLSREGFKLSRRKVCVSKEDSFMGLRIMTNVPSISAQRAMSVTTKAQESTLSKLSSGSRIASAADDAAGLAISENLKANIRSLRQADRNANDGVSLIQTAEGGLSEISNVLVRLRELSIQSASDTVGDQERSFSDLEFQSLKEEVDRISNSTEFNGKKLLNGQGDTLEFQIGMNNTPEEDRVTYETSKVNSGISALGIDGLDIMEKSNAQNGLTAIDEALNNISQQRSVLGAIQNRLNSTSNGLQMAAENLSAANSRIRDTDYALESANNAKLNILSMAGGAVLSQTNQMGSLAVKLVNG
jgi:flagellin